MVLRIAAEMALPIDPMLRKGGRHSLRDVHHIRWPQASIAAALIYSAVLFSLSALAVEPLAKLKHSGAVRALEFSPDGKLLATVSQDSRAIYLWQASTGKAAGSVPTLPN